MSTTHTIDAEAVADQLVEDTVTAIEYLSTQLGVELGLYSALHQHGPATPKALAERTSIDARYAREWLEQQVAAGRLTCEDPQAAPDDRVFVIPPAVAAVLADPDSDYYVAPLTGALRGVVDVMGDLPEAFRTGAGISFSAYGHHLRHGLGQLNGGTFDASMGDWIQTLGQDVHDRLVSSDEPRILDLGCGTGRSSIALAHRYPRASVLGIDLDQASIDEARAAAASAGVADRVTFQCADAATVEVDESVDLVTIFEALHDMGDPVGALRVARSALTEGGACYVVDEFVAHEFGPDASLNERLQYGFSVLHCLPATVAEDPVTAHGTILRMPTVEDWARRAGFSSVADLGIEDPFWRHYRIAV